MSAKKLFWLLFLLNLFNYIDRQVLYSVFPLIQADLKIADWQLGALASVFMVAYMCYAPVVGYFADRTQRQKWIGASAIIWSIATWATGLARGFGTLALARAVTGMGEAGFTSISQPFLAEHYPPHKRATLLACLGLALPLGSALGYFLGGFIGQHFGWRLAFMIVAVPGVLLGLLALTQIKDPSHQNQTRAARPKLNDYASLFQNKAFVFLCLAQAMATFVQGGLSAWIPTYFHRYFEMSVAQAGLIFGSMVVVCGAAGVYMGGRLADRLIKKNHRAYYLITFVSLFLMLPAAWLGVLAQQLWVALALFSVAMTLLFMPMAPLAAALVSLTKPAVRSMAFALNLFIIHALGDAISPVIIGQASDWWGLKTAILLGCLAILPGCLFAACAGLKAPAQEEQ